MKTAKKDKDKDKKGRNTWRSADVKLRAIKLSKSGKSRSEIAKEMNISYMTVKNWLQNESKIVQHIENSPDISTTKITKSRPAILEKLEKMLFVWIEDCNNNLKFPLSQALIQEKALRIFEKLTKVILVASYALSTIKNGKFKRKLKTVHHLNFQLLRI